MKTIHLISLSALLLPAKIHAQKTFNNETSASNDTGKTQVPVSISPGFDVVKASPTQSFKKASVNLLVSYAKGVDGFQVSSLVNICNGHARYFQGTG
ncbi:MAG TPA: hypothetical protein VD905_18510, partial [Flavobacteriales bacterium]|nr:hypothetical protein [Flavobacteriales bacterium]